LNRKGREERKGKAELKIEQMATRSTFGIVAD
jgi:hypothetical protein